MFHQEMDGFDVKQNSLYQSRHDLKNKGADSISYKQRMCNRKCFRGRRGISFFTLEKTAKLMI
jgi:hypothetical protein